MAGRRPRAAAGRVLPGESGATPPKWGGRGRRRCGLRIPRIRTPPSEVVADLDAVGARVAVADVLVAEKVPAAAVQVPLVQQVPGPQRQLPAGGGRWLPAEPGIDEAAAAERVQWLVGGLHVRRGAVA